MPNAFSDPLVILNPPFQSMETADFPAKTPVQLTPNGADPLYEGEIVTVGGDGTANDVGLIKRAGPTDASATLFLGQRGRTDIQSSKKAPIALQRPLRVKHKMVLGTGVSKGDLLMAGTVSYDGANKTGLIKATATNYALARVLEKGTNSAQPDGSYWTLEWFPMPIVTP